MISPGSGPLSALVDLLQFLSTAKEAEEDKAWARVLGYSTLLIQDPHGQVVGAGMTFQDITAFQKKQP